MDKSGSYSVKSGCRMLTSEVSTCIGGSLFGRLSVPPKVKHLLWRVCCDCLPTNVALLSKKVDISTVCVICNGEVEDDFHSLVRCPAALQVLHKLGFKITISGVFSFASWWDLFLQNHTVDDCNLAAMILWSI